MARAALVTGAAGGIGRAVAERLLEDGLDVLSVDLEADGLPGTAFAARASSTSRPSRSSPRTSGSC
jgi:NAD(P)-dependent dehydrogenase (short-subunit alcohol dehydrogenase family)